MQKPVVHMIHVRLPEENKNMLPWIAALIARDLTRPKHKAGGEV